MRNVLNVKCGTYRADPFTINLDDYEDAIWAKTNADEFDTKKACDILEDILGSGKRFASAGNRNNPAVNSCIALHVMGYDPVEWFYIFFNLEKDRFYSSDIESFKEHIERVSEYLHIWGPAGSETDAFEYLV